MFSNMAFSNPISEITDTALLSSFNGVEIYDNWMLDYADLVIEGRRCLNLCFIGQEYLTYFSHNFNNLF